MPRPIGPAWARGQRAKVGANPYVDTSDTGDAAMNRTLSETAARAINRAKVGQATQTPVNPLHGLEDFIGGALKRLGQKGGPRKKPPVYDSPEDAAAFEAHNQATLAKAKALLGGK